MILAGDYGFHATRAAVPTTPPARPAFDLDVNSDTAPIGDGMTTASSVTLVGRTDPNLSVTLQPSGAVTRSDPNGLFVFFNVPLAAGNNAFTVIATNAGAVSSQFTKVVTRTLVGLDLTPPVISARLADDTGRSALDNITRDDTVTGSITSTNPIVSFQAQIDQSPVTTALGTLGGTTFTITPALLATLNGGPLADGKHTLTLIAKDANGNVSSPSSLSFILAATAPAAVIPQLLPADDTGVSYGDGITRIITPTFKVDAPAGSIVRLIVDGVPVGEATANNGPAFVTSTPLTPGPHLVTATAEDVAGNVGAAATPIALTIRTTPPATPTLALDPASQFPAGQASQTDKEVVNLSGRPTPAPSSPSTASSTRTRRSG